MSNAGHAIEVHILTTNATPDAGGADLCDGINKADLGLMRDLLETTDFKDTTGVKTRLAALKDSDMSVDGDLEASDTVQQRLRDAYDNGTSVFVNYYPNPSGGALVKGFQVEMLVESEKHAGDVAGKATCSWSLKGTGVATRI